ncbi:MAG TPA: hypothetical protein VK541_21475 [Pedobacter sp.]|uniref:hypothetical protein n=1 Tax=Pedobacter sp. TaxID=1411316 RepID=UPI002C9E96D4|nr:hypothetical protein [Pedobacter sp.]HMI05071.1 hypothetical protein [Pedobacter sp.]
MKRLILLTMLGFASAIATTAQAQVSINVSIGSQPRWAPVYYEEVAYTPVVTRYYAPAPRYVSVRRHYRSAPVYYSAPRHYKHYKGHKVKYYSAPRRHNYRYREVRGNRSHGHYKSERRDRGIDRIIRPRG